MVTWKALRRRALDEADPAWFGAIAPILVERARHSRLGRRMLARRLASRGAPLLFGTVPRSTPQAVAVSAWTEWPAARLREVALDLGAIALAPALRSLVGRDAVLRIRGVLGDERYAFALADAGDRPPPAPRAQAALTKALGSDDAFGALVRTRGFGEFLAFAHAVHPVCAERILLCEPPGSIAEARMPWLPGARVATHLAGLPAANDERPSDGAGSDH